jgi:hypothetical protein
MENEKAARKALNYDGHKLHGRRLRVNKAEKKVEIEEKRLKIGGNEETKGSSQRNEEEKGGKNDIIDRHVRQHLGRRNDD